MKKKNVIIGILTVVSTLLVVCLIGFSPNLIKRLLGNVNSTEIGTTQTLKTGVIVDTNLAYKKDTTSMPLKIYNGSDKQVTINAIIWRTMCLSDTCEDFNVINLDTPITVEPDSDYEYIMENVSSLVNTSAVDVGVQYVLDGKTYNLASRSTRITNFDNYTLNKNSAEDVPEEFTFIHNPENENSADVNIKLSDTDVKMDLSESLDSLNITYSYRSSIKNGMIFNHPENRSSLANPLLGNENTSNVKQYFSSNMFDKTTHIQNNTSIDEYNSSYQFTLTGKPNMVVNNTNIVLGFYFTQSYWYQDSENISRNESFFSNKNDFSSEKIPQFKLTVYDKSELATAISNGIAKMEQLSEEEANIDSFMEFSNLIYNEGVTVYENREVTQAQIDDITNRINGFEIELNPKADYTALDNVISKINNLNRSYYAEGSFTDIDALIKKYESDLSSNYQSKIDSLSTKLNGAYNSLEMLDADYKNVDSAITTAGLLTNETSDGKALYTTESWGNLQEALASVVRGKKIDEQQIVDSYAKNITVAIANLEYNPADYTELNAMIEEWNLLKDYFTEESRTEVEEYLKTITFDKNITEQSTVDTWVQELNSLAEKLELKRAQGYYDSDNYEFIEKNGYMSLEGYKKYFEGLEKSYYTDESVEIIDMVVTELSNSESDLYKYSIMEQAEFDEILMFLQVYVNTLEKKPGNYEELCEYYVKALSLNIKYYVDVTELTTAISNANFNWKIDEQDKIDESAKALRDAINNLVLKDADYTAFNIAYNKAVSLSAKHYVDFSSVQAAITKANSVKDLKIDKQSLVDDVTDKLNKAMSKLVLRDADYSKIDALKAKIEALDGSKYTNFEVVKEALNNISYGKKANEQALVDEMYNKLKSAYDSLEKTKADYTEVNKAVLEAKKYESVKDNYSNYSDLEKVLNSINYNLTWADQVTVDNYVIKIKDAISNLRKKLANYTELENLISKIPSDYSDLDQSLQSEIKTLLKEAEQLSRNLTYEEQAKVDSLVIKFRALIDKLPKIDSGEISKEIILSYLKVNGDKVDIKTLPFRCNVGYDVTSANIEVGLASKNSVIKIYGGKVLLPGENNVTIIVTTSAGKTYTYTLVIDRSKTSDYLSNLTVKESEIEFSKTKQEYTVKVGKNTNELDLSAVAEDKNAKVTIKGNDSIKNGSKVFVEVESADGSVRVYTLNVQKAGSVDVKVIIILIMILAILSGIIKYLQEKKKYKEEKNA